MNLQKIKCLKTTYLRQLDPTNDWLILAIKVTLASLFAALIAKLFVSEQAMFLILSSILFTLTNPDANKKQMFLAILIAGVLGTSGVVLVTLANQHLFLLLIITCIYVAISCYVNYLNTIYGMAGLLALLLIIIAGGSIGNDVTTALARMSNCLLGLAIALFISFILLPKKPARKLKRGLLVLFSDICDYFYHTTADCLRGNHINPRHWQIKERILLALSKGRNLFKDLKPSSEATILLKKLFLAQEQLLLYLVPLTNVMTSPGNNSAFINILPALADFSAEAHSLLKSYKNYLQQPATGMINETHFLKAVNILEDEINTMIKQTLDRAIVYHWPFDLSIFAYTLKLFAKEMLTFKTTLLSLTK